jgi:hypothetical protein
MPRPRPSGGEGGIAEGAGGGGAECPPCEGTTPVCHEATVTCKTCTATEGCEDPSPLCDEKANDGLGECIAAPVGAGGASGEGGAGGEGGTWICTPTYYGDGDCDCGCGVLDVDCEDATVDSCDFCFGCATACDQITPDENWTCVADGWQCPGTLYGDGNCDCGCGATDVDCEDATVGSCDTCVGCNVSEECPGDIDESDNAVCDGGWICSLLWYGDGECDCGCGIQDPDCGDLLVESCIYCIGCAAGDCEALQPTNNPECI